MINERAGASVEIDGQPFVRVRPGFTGHAVYGPYETLEPGTYEVEFRIKPLCEHADGRDPLCAFIDIVAGPEHRLFEALAFRSLIGEDGRYIASFQTRRRLTHVEYRLFANGAEPLLLGGSPRVAKVEALREAPRLASPPPLLRDHGARIWQVFEAGVGVAVLGQHLIATGCGVSFHIRELDDLNFINEVMVKNAYNILTPSPACVVDIGMNIGLTTLRLAASPHVREVHAFEPFASTFARAAANVSLNPALQDKIHMHNFGLLDRETELTTHVNSRDSGSYSVFGPGQGEPVKIQLRDATATLRPIIDAAQARGLLVVLKVDCEGSEFAVFRSLEAGGLIGRVAAYMVEYHHGHGPAEELTSRLTSAGFVVVDLGSPGSNGFFYAVRLGGLAAAPDV